MRLITLLATQICYDSVQDLITQALFWQAKPV